jgi:hypothetical protein
MEYGRTLASALELLSFNVFFARPLCLVCTPTQRVNPFSCIPSPASLCMHPYSRFPVPALPCMFPDARFPIHANLFTYAPGELARATGQPAAGYRVTAPAVHRHTF